MDKYTITEEHTTEEYEQIFKRMIALVHDVETLWFEKPELNQFQVAETVASSLRLPDLIILASAYLAHFVRGGEDIS